MINTELEKRFSSVSPDGKSIFFLKTYDREHQDYYWMDAGLTDELKNIN